MWAPSTSSPPAPAPSSGQASASPRLLGSSALPLRGFHLRTMWSRREWRWPVGQTPLERARPGCRSQGPAGAEVEQRKLEAPEVGDLQLGSPPPPPAGPGHTRTLPTKQGLVCVSPGVIACDSSLDHVCMPFLLFQRQKLNRWRGLPERVLLLLAASGSRQRVAACLASRDGWQCSRCLRAAEGEQGPRFPHLFPSSQLLPRQHREVPLRPEPQAEAACSVLFLLT